MWYGRPMTSHQDISGLVAAVVMPVFAFGGLNDPIAAGLSGAALASLFKLGVIDLAAMTFWKSVELAGKFIVTCLSGAAAALFGSPYLCLRLNVTELEARVFVYFIVGLVGSMAVRLIASNDRAIVAQVVQLLTNLTTKTPPKRTPPKTGG